MRNISRVMLMVVVAGCTSAEAAQQQQQAPPSGSVAPFIQHPENIQPGITLASRFTALSNPYDGNAARRDEGAKLFIAYNCMDCHGADGSGAMAPAFTDNRWHFGGSNGEVFQSIYEGRPEGMPSWGGRISDADIWRLVTYVRSLGIGKDVSTENFTGKTIKRSGH